MLTLERFHHIEWAVRKAGYRDTIEWSEAIASVQDADGFAQAAIYVICNSGMRVTVAAPIAERCIVQLRNGQSATSVFGHPGKSEAIDLIWRDRADLFAAFEAADDKIAFCQTLPWIGPVTKFHLAKNLGIDAAKPDVHLDRLAKRENVTTEQLCARLARETGYRVSTIDTILWRACADGILNSRHYARYGWDDALREMV